jgi:hypothetical protein
MNQLQTFIPRHQFENLVSRHSGDRYVKSFTCWKQLTVMLYAQISGKDSLRDIVNAFMAQTDKLYHIGLDIVRRSTLAEANQKRDYRMYEGLFYTLLERCRNITPKHKFRFKNPLVLFDATVIDLCLAAFPWAKFRTTKGAIKLHCQLAHAGQMPTFMVVTDAKQHEITIARSSFPIVPDSIYCMDKGYIDFSWFHTIDTAGAFFVTRAKDNLNYTVTGQHTQPSKKSVISDEIITLNGFYQKQQYPKELRLIHYYDSETDKLLVFVTNNMTLAAVTIAAIYKARWQIEVFFKWIKQNLKIKTFLGTSKNAVLTQVWIAMCYYLILSYIKFQSRCTNSLFYMHKVIQETLLDRINLIDILRANDRLLPKIKNTDHQLTLAFTF